MNELEIVQRVMLAACFGAAIGLERQWHHKAAGLKTNCLVALGAATYGLISEHGFGPGSNPAQVAAGVVTGIGFIGGGVIMRQGGNVQGVNSAATLWVTAGLGLALGAGFYRMAWLMLAVVLLTQVVLRKAAHWVDEHSGQIVPTTTYLVTATALPSAIASVRAGWDEFAAHTGVEVIGYSETQENPSAVLWELTCRLAPTRALELTDLSQRLAALADVQQARWSQSQTEANEL